MTTTLDTSDFDTPGTGRGLLDVFRWHYLLRLLIRTGVTTRYRHSVLGWGWSYVKPGAQFLVFWVVFGAFLGFNRGIDNYAIYLFSGIIIINFFSEAFHNGTTAIVNNAPLVRKVYLPRQLFAVSAIAVALVHFLPQVALLVAVVLFLGWIVHVSVLGILAVLAAVLITALFALGLGLLFGAINVRFRDAENIVDLLLLLATWASPVMYFWTMVRDHVPNWLLQIYLLNPLTEAVSLFHYAFWDTVTDAGPNLALPPDLGINVVWTLLISVVTILIGQAVFRRLEGKFAQDL